MFPKTMATFQTDCICLYLHSKSFYPGGALTIYLYQSPKKLLQHPEGPINIRRDFITTRYRWKGEGGSDKRGGEGKAAKTKKKSEGRSVSSRCLLQGDTLCGV